MPGPIARLAVSSYNRYASCRFQSSITHAFVMLALPILSIPIRILLFLAVPVNKKNTLCGATSINDSLRDRILGLHWLITLGMTAPSLRFVSTVIA